MKIDDLTKGNVWGVSEADLNQMLLEGKKDENWEDDQARYMNIIRPVFNIQYLDRNQDRIVKKLEAEGYDIFSIPSEGDYNAIAIKKRQIRRITELTLENISHVSADQVLALISANMGTGWQGLPLALQDIIESAFYVDSSILPEYAMHRKDGIISRRKADGYDVLEIQRGNWIEAIFLKPKPKVEKIHFTATITQEDNDSENNDESDEIPDDENENMMEEDSDAETMEDTDNPKLEDIDAIDPSSIEEEE